LVLHKERLFNCKIGSEPPRNHWIQLFPTISTMVILSSEDMAIFHSRAFSLMRFGMR
jgi:hypothetical protein